MADSIVPTARAPKRLAPARTFAAGVTRRIVLALGRRMRQGSIIVVDDTGTKRLGSGEPVVRVEIHDARAYAALARRGSVGLGSSYVEGWWDADDLTGLVRILERNLDATGARLDALARAVAPFRAPMRLRTRSDKEADRRDVRAHYDLGNDFFELMLDETMSYSCAFFDDPSVSLATAQRAKLDRLCQKLGLRPGDHVVEIGTGWGSFAVHAAVNYGCRVTTTTISDAQYEYAAKRVVDAGLGSLVTVCNQDYRDLGGRFDKLVSIEMIEAIGWRQLDTFFTTCARLLRPEGLMGLQAIVIDDRSYERSKGHDDLIKSLVFPGSFLPSIEALARSIVGRTDLRIVDLEDIGRHYAETLRRWRERVDAGAAQVEAMGLGDRFLRLWRMYLSYCEAAFLERHISDVQVVLARSGWRAPLERGALRS